MTTPSVFTGMPGNCAYPSKPPPRLHVQMFRYLDGFHGATPPDAARFTGSPVTPNAVFVVRVRVIPFVFFPFGSLVASANWTLASVTSPFHGVGTLLLSAFEAR